MDLRWAFFMNFQIRLLVELITLHYTNVERCEFKNAEVHHTFIYGLRRVYREL